MLIQPYLFFEGRCDEAIEFYRKAVGAEVVMLMRYKDCPDPAQCKPETLDKVMHAAFKVGDSVVLASDGYCNEADRKFEGFSLTLNVQSDADAQRYFAALSEGGKVTMPMDKTFFASSFGMLHDRFGVGWMVIKPTHP